VATTDVMTAGTKARKVPSRTSRVKRAPPSGTLYMAASPAPAAQAITIRLSSAANPAREASRVANTAAISRGAVSLIKQNYAIVTGLNTLALVLALPGGLVSPVMTAMISNGSAIMAAINGMRPILRYQ